MRLLFAALLVASSAAHAYELKRDSTGEPAAWKTPLHFIVDEDLEKRLKTTGSMSAVTAALKTVNDAIPSLTLSASSGKPHGVGYDFEHPEQSTSDVLAPSEWTWNVDAVATTVITISRATHQIIEADIAFNVKHTDFEIAGSGHHSVAAYDVQNAMTHELGHALGLAHNAIPNTVMFPSSLPGETSKRTLASDDIEGLKFLYGQLPAAVTPVETAAGCSAAGSAPFAIVALMMGVLLRRRRVFVALAAVLGAVVFVAPVFASAPAVAQVWTVSSVTTLPPGAGPTVLESVVTFTRAGQVHTLRIPGGRWGDIEQFVEGFDVPMVGETFTSP
jgi:uncharacterized protein (TIGR03382 family)